jgi:hypothetical protein
MLNGRRHRRLPHTGREYLAGQEQVDAGGAMAREIRVASSLLALVLLAGCADAGPLGPEAGAPAVTAAAGGQSAFPNQEELDEIAAKVRKMGEGEFATVYAGLAIDVHHDRVDVWVTDSATFKAAVDAQPWGARVRLRPARHAAADLEPTFQRILRDQSYWRQRGLPVGYSGVRVDGACIDVGTPDPKRAEREFPQRYPGVPMCFSAQPDVGNPWQER